MDTLCLSILSLILSSLHICHLTFGLNEFKETPDVSQVLLASAGAISIEVNNKMTNIMQCCRHMNIFKYGSYILKCLEQITCQFFLLLVKLLFYCKFHFRLFFFLVFI